MNSCLEAYPPFSLIYFVWITNVVDLDERIYYIRMHQKYYLNVLRLSKCLYHDIFWKVLILQNCFFVFVVTFLASGLLRKCLMVSSIFSTQYELFSAHQIYTSGEGSNFASVSFPLKANSDRKRQSSYETTYVNNVTRSLERI